MGEPALTDRRRDATAASPPESTPYEVDLYAWVQEQAALLRSGSADGLDLADIAGDLSDVGAEQFDKLKWDHQPARRSRCWVPTIEEHRLRAEKQLRKNSSLRSRLEDAIEDGFRLGRLKAAREMRVSPKTLPSACPYDWAAIMTRDFSLDGE